MQKHLETRPKSFFSSSVNWFIRMSTWGCRWEENQVQYYELKDSDLSVHATVSSRPNVLNKMFPLIGEYCFLCSTLWLGGSVRPMVRHSVSNRARAIALLQNIGGLHCDSFTEACQRLHATYFLAIVSLTLICLLRAFCTASWNCCLFFTLEGADLKTSLRRQTPEFFLGLYPTSWLVCHY